MDRPRRGSWPFPTTDLVTKFDEGFLLGIKVELSGMEDWWCQSRVK